MRILTRHDQLLAIKKPHPPRLHPATIPPSFFTIIQQLHMVIYDILHFVNTKHFVLIETAAYWHLAQQSAYTTT